MSMQLEAALSASDVATELARAVYGSDGKGHVRSPGELRLAVLEWLLDLTGDPAIAARTVLARRADHHAVALPHIVVDLLEQIAGSDTARFQRVGRRRAQRSVM